MKNKKNIYFLLPAVLIIWGILGYRVFTSLSPNNSVQQEITTTNFKPQQLTEAESFTINTDYRDPFLGTLQKQPQKTTKKTTKRVVKKTTKPFPKIIYKGLVSPNGKNQKVFLVNINGQQYFLKKNAVQQGVQLIKGTNKEIILKFEGEQQTFSIEK